MWAVSGPDTRGMAKAAPGALVSEVSGKFSGLVVVNGKGGLVIRRPPQYRRVLSPSQRAATSRLRRASAVWSGLSPAQAAAWDQYGRTLPRTDPLTGRSYLTAGFNAFSALATKVLQVDGGAVVPIVPPATDYSGDAVTFSLVGGQGGWDPTPGPGGLLVPTVASSEAGAIVVQASGPNEPGSVTELMLERLPNGRRKATGRMAAAAFHRFVAGGLTFSLPVEPGWYVVAARFVRAATGQQTAPLLLGRVQVG